MQKSVRIDPAYCDSIAVEASQRGWKLCVGDSATAFWWNKGNWIIQESYLGPGFWVIYEEPSEILWPVSENSIDVSSLQEGMDVVDSLLMDEECRDD